MVIALLLVNPITMWLGFLLYAGALQCWNRITWYEKAVALLAIIPFGAIDIAFSQTWGVIYYDDWCLTHYEWQDWKSINNYTFSMRTQYWYHESGTNQLRADYMAVQLNNVVDGHIV